MVTQYYVTVLVAHDYDCVFAKEGNYDSLLRNLVGAIGGQCAAYMLQVLNDFCAELPFSGDDCCIYRNILKEAREGLPYRYTGLRA